MESNLQGKADNLDEGSLSVAWVRKTRRNNVAASGAIGAQG